MFCDLVIRLFLCFTCPAMTVVTVILWALDRVRGRALGWLGPGSPKSQPHQGNVVSPSAIKSLRYSRLFAFMARLWRKGAIYFVCGAGGGGGGASSTVCKPWLLAWPVHFTIYSEFPRYPSKSEAALPRRQAPAPGLGWPSGHGKWGRPGHWISREGTGFVFLCDYGCGLLL